MSKMTYRTIIALFAALTAIVMVLMGLGGCEDPGGYGSVEPVVFNRLIIHNSPTAPPMDNPRHEIWRDALTCVVYASDSAFVTVPADSAPPSLKDITFGILADTIVDSTDVQLKAISSGEYLYLRAFWYDKPVGGGDSRPSYSTWERPGYHFLDTMIDTTPPPPADTIIIDFWSRRSLRVDSIPVPQGFYYDTTFYKQDRFAIIWDTGENGDEGADCRSMCHEPGNESVNGHRMYTTGGGYVDVWQWQAGTADPVLLAQDEYWDINGRNLDAFTQGITSNNFDTVFQLPVNMHREATNFTGPFLHAADVVPFDSTLNWKHRDLISAYILNGNADGSLADVDCYSSFNLLTGRWMILMRRKLSTGYPDDVDLSGVAAGDSVMISVAFMNHSDSTHFGSRPFYIIFP